MGYQAGKELAQLQPTAATWLALGTFVSLQLGGWVFAAGFPEKQFPGVFDYAFFSHQLMHVFAAAAHVLEYLFVWELHKQSMLQTA
jgi:predicted membrane channel-forming protein YqfA (hemolysin III family)